MPQKPSWCLNEQVCQEWGVKHLERSNGLDTALYKDIPFRHSLDWLLGICNVIDGPSHKFVLCSLCKIFKIHQRHFISNGSTLSLHAESSLTLVDMDMLLAFHIRFSLAMPAVASPIIALLSSQDLLFKP